MEISYKQKEILLRKKQSLRERCGCREGCEKCAVQFEDYLLFAQANIPIKYWDKEAEDLDEANEGVRARISKYCALLPQRLEYGMGLFLVGGNGAGKTLVASIILKHALRQKFSGRFTTFNEIVSMATDGTYDVDARHKYQRDFIDVDFLVIDDITKIYKNTDKKSSTFIDMQLDRLFRARANANLPIIITSNHTRQEALKSADEVLANSLLSLFAEHLTDITFVGRDRRQVNDRVQGSIESGTQSSSD